jgi:cell division protein FtsB
MGVGLIPTAVSAGVSIAGLIGKIQKLTSKDPNAITQADLGELQAENDALRKEIEQLEDRE